MMKKMRSIGKKSYFYLKTGKKHNNKTEIHPLNRQIDILKIVL